MDGLDLAMPTEIMMLRGKMCPLSGLNGRAKRIEIQVSNLDVYSTLKFWYLQCYPEVSNLGVYSTWRL
jgi:hypothetical protein